MLLNFSFKFLKYPKLIKKHCHFPFLSEIIPKSICRVNPNMCSIHYTLNKGTRPIDYILNKCTTPIQQIYLSTKFLFKSHFFRRFSRFFPVKPQKQMSNKHKLWHNYYTQYEYISLNRKSE